MPEAPAPITTTCFRSMFEGMMVIRYVPNEQETECFELRSTSGANLGNI